MADRYDSFVKHVLIPVPGSSSFLINDSPNGKLKKRQYWHGTWFVTFCAVIILPMIGSGRHVEAEEKKLPEFRGGKHLKKEQ